MKKSKRRRCSLCDDWYDELDTEENRVHQHPEPQSGFYRRALISTGLSYEDWIKLTREGSEWVEYRRSLMKRD